MYVQPRLQAAGHSIVFRRLVKKHGYVIPEAPGNDGWEEINTGRLVIEFVYYEGIQFKFQGITEMNGEIFEIVKDDGVPDVPREWLEQRVKEASMNEALAKENEEKKPQEVKEDKEEFCDSNGNSFYAGLTLSPPPPISNPDKKSSMPSSRFFSQFSSGSREKPRTSVSPNSNSKAGGMLSNPMCETIRALSSNLSSIKPTGLKPPMLKPKPQIQPTSETKPEEKPINIKQSIQEQQPSQETPIKPNQIEESKSQSSKDSFQTAEKENPSSNQLPSEKKSDEIPIRKKRRLADDIEEVEEEIPAEESLNRNYPLFSLDPNTTDNDLNIKDVLRSPAIRPSPREDHKAKEPNSFPRKRRLQKIRNIEDVCPICLMELKDAEERGLLECKHRFCFTCISDWSQVTNLCPCCKGSFSYILKLFQGKQEKVFVEEKKIEIEEEESEDEDEVCYRCGADTDEMNIIVCDFCNFMCAHYYCVGLRRLPRGQWYCDTCRIDLRSLDSRRVRRGRASARLLGNELGQATSTFT